MLSQWSRSSNEGEETRSWPTIAARHRCELLCVMAMHNLEWQAIDNVDTEGLDVSDICEETGKMF